jgi:hypothetical protein
VRRTSPPPTLSVLVIPENLDSQNFSQLPILEGLQFFQSFGQLLDLTQLPSFTPEFLDLGPKSF